MQNILSATRAAILAVLFALAGMTACGDPPMGPEEAIRAWVRDGQAAAESKDGNTLIDMVSPAYTDARGNERDDLENILRLSFLRQQKVVLITRIEDLTVYDDSAAQLTLRVGMAGTNNSRLGLSADAYRFELELERERDEWLLISARWGQLGEAVR